MKLHLRELELYGVKSFGEKAFLAFPSNLSVIVGGNGCGKSNLVDAIRWALGDQSFRNLRISEAEDLLYVGDKSLNMAWVRLMFESAEGSFELQRKVYRNGESEYSLNGQAVRLKDIQKFLAQHQIGTRGFTIVNQGSADLFIRATPDERYLMLSEMLGVRALELKRIETKKNLETVKERLKLARMKLNVFQPQAEIFKAEQEKSRRKKEIEARLQELNQLIQSKRKFLLQQRLKQIQAQLAQVAFEREEAEKKTEVFGEALEASPNRALIELRKQESELWQKRSSLLEKIRRQPAAAIQPLKFVREKLNLVLQLETVAQIKKVIQAVLDFLAGDKARVEKAEDVTRLDDEIEKTDQEIKQVKSQIMTEEKKDKELEKQTHERLMKFKELQGRVFQLKHTEEKLDEELAGLTVAQKELEKVKSEKATEAELSALIHEAERLKEEFYRLGELNEEIIAKGARILRQLETLRHETVEFEDTYTKLQNLLNDYQAQIQTTFEAGVKKINQALLEYFYKFYGGEAKLILKDENKVHLTVNHPQKRIKLLEALSGGEKALFSIALIFALIKISTPPFLVLDEIDAALDESNAYKFSQFLKELSQKTQFIIVSHNRATIEAADVLFGVSLQKGASKVFSLKLKEALETIEV